MPEKTNSRILCPLSVLKIDPAWDFKWRSWIPCPGLNLHVIRVTLWDPVFLQVKWDICRIYEETLTSSCRWNSKVSLFWSMQVLTSMYCFFLSIIHVFCEFCEDAMYICICIYRNVLSAHPDRMRPFTMQRRAQNRLNKYLFFKNCWIYFIAPHCLSEVVYTEF